MIRAELSMCERGVSGGRREEESRKSSFRGILTWSVLELVDRPNGTSSSSSSPVFFCLLIRTSLMLVLDHISAAFLHPVPSHGSQNSHHESHFELIRALSVYVCPTGTINSFNCMKAFRGIHSTGTVIYTLWDIGL